MSVIGRWLVVVLAATCSGCVTIRESFQKHGLERAAFEMDCPAEKLTIKVLTEEGKEDGILDYGSQVGVSGCNRRMIYFYGGAHEWWSNSERHEDQDNNNAPGSKMR